MKRVFSFENEYQLSLLTDIEGVTIGGGECETSFAYDAGAVIGFVFRTGFGGHLGLSNAVTTWIIQYNNC